MRFEQLEQFVALGSLEHFRQAAEKTNISTSALTRSIQTLEEEIGCQLVLRSTRSVKLTEQGKLFLEYCKKTLEELESAKKSITKSLYGKEQGKLVIGYTSQMSSLVPMACGEFLAKFPHIKVEMQLLDESELTRKLQLGEIDISVYLESSEQTSSDFQLPDQLILFTSSEHPLIKSSMLSKVELEQFPMFGCFSQSKQVQAMLNEAAEGFNKSSTMKVGSIDQVISGVRDGQHFALAGIEHAKCIGQDPSLKLLKTNQDMMTKQLIVRTNHHLSGEDHVKELVTLLELNAQQFEPAL